MTEIIKQAQKLGCSLLDNAEKKGEVFINPLSDKDFNYLNLSLIQKWLRDEKGVDFDITCNYNNYDLETYFDKNIHLHFASYGLDTYEQALQEGILHALKQLENE